MLTFCQVSPPRVLSFSERLIISNMNNMKRIHTVHFITAIFHIVSIFINFYELIDRECVNILVSCDACIRHWNGSSLVQLIAFTCSVPNHHRIQWCLIANFQTIVLYCIILYCIVLCCVALRYVALRCVALCCVALHCIALHCVIVYFHIG